MNAQELIDIAKAMVAGDKGRLAMDESIAIYNKQFEKVGIAQNRNGKDMKPTIPLPIYRLPGQTPEGE